MIMFPIHLEFHSPVSEVNDKGQHPPTSPKGEILKNRLAAKVWRYKPPLNVAPFGPARCALDSQPCAAERQNR